MYHLGFIDMHGHKNMEIPKESPRLGRDCIYMDIAFAYCNEKKNKKKKRS